MIKVAEPQQEGERYDLVSDPVRYGAQRHPVDIGARTAIRNKDTHSYPDTATATGDFHLV